MTSLHNRVFGTIERSLDPWFTSLLARFVFAAVLLVYYLNSASTKVGAGLAGFFTIGDNAYFQIIPNVVEAHGYDVSQIPLFPYGLIVAAGTYAEFLLPLLIVAGAFTRIAALGMIIFISVQSYVDIAFHGLEEKAIGGWFDRFSDAVILDQRALWIFLLLYLVIRGAGAVSVDAIVGSLSGGKKSAD